jgi:hypothetical protein
VDTLRVIENTLCQGGFPGIDMGTDSNISQFCEVARHGNLLNTPFNVLICLKKLALKIQGRKLKKEKRALKDVPVGKASVHSKIDGRRKVTIESKYRKQLKITFPGRSCACGISGGTRDPFPHACGCLTKRTPKSAGLGINEKTSIPPSIHSFTSWKPPWNCRLL